MPNASKRGGSTLLSWHHIQRPPLSDGIFNWAPTRQARTPLLQIVVLASVPMVRGGGQWGINGLSAERGLDM